MKQKKWRIAPRRMKGDIKLGKSSSDAQSQTMTAFFRQVDCIKMDIEAIRKASQSIGELNEATMWATTARQEKDVPDNVQPLVDEAYKQAKRVQATLGVFHQETKELKDQKSLMPSDLRIREHLGSTLTSKFIGRNDNLPASTTNVQKQHYSKDYTTGAGCQT
mmetsp:Transcript_18752/g.37611  ORF Transcript_18752/g.37611 Transcript_18752/m.37611 type:complete len:163 (+) Transcript_18752:1269-1757(+)